MADMRLYKQLGRDIAARRDALGMTQARLAEKIGLARASLANVESGRQRIMLHQLYKLVSALQLNSLDELVPPTWDFSDDVEAPAISGDLTASQQAVLQNFVRTALTVNKGKKRP